MNGCEYEMCSHWNGKACTYEGGFCVHRNESQRANELETELAAAQREIERLKAERDRMREALEKIAKIDYLRWIVSRYEVTQESGKQAVLLAETALNRAKEKG